MSIVWAYIENKDNEQYFCLHCNNLTETAFFHSDFEIEDEKDCHKIGPGHVICMRCARVLTKLYQRIQSETQS